MSERFSIVERLASFGHAVKGLAILLREEHNARIHLVATTGVILLGVFLGVSRLEWVALLVAVALVWVAEALNSALEALADALHPQQHPLVGKAKDLAAAAVLVAAVVAVMIGLLIFLPYLLP